MIEAYAFLATFTLQILAMSVLHPTWFVRYLRRQANLIPPERLAQLYPNVDVGLARERFLTRYRMLNTGIAMLGLLLLGWLVGYLQRPAWSDGLVEIVVTIYFVVQALLPLAFVIWHGVRFNRTHRRPVADGKRKASLHRRELLDFVAPLPVVLAVVSYLLFAAFVVYLVQQSTLGRAALATLGAITLVYALNAFVVYAAVYGKKPNPFETHESRVHTIGLTVKANVYSCIVCVVFLGLDLALVLLDLRKWAPFALSTFYVITALVSLMGMFASPRKLAPPLLGT